MQHLIDIRPALSHPGLPRGVLYKEISKTIGKEYHTARIKTVAEAGLVLSVVEGLQKTIGSSTSSTKDIYYELKDYRRLYTTERIIEIDDNYIKELEQREEKMLAVFKEIYVEAKECIQHDIDMSSTWLEAVARERIEDITGELIEEVSND